MTFPILGAFCIRDGDDSDASVLGSLYFANSIGAAAGALFATFVLVPALGTPGAMHVAGWINLLVGFAAVILAIGGTTTGMQHLRDAMSSIAPALQPSDRAYQLESRRLWIAMLFAAAITGATSFIYEIAWIRLLNLVLGTTQHSFELVLSAFIFGLAIGGLLIRWLGRTGVKDLVRAAGLAQIAMGIVTLLCLLLYSRSFGLVEWIIAATAPTAGGYKLFLLGTAAVALLTVMPAAILAGMTLPLMTAAITNRGQGTASIGHIYAANTFGAICGVFVALQLLVPFIGVRLSLIFAALIDVLLGIVLLRRYSSSPNGGLSIICSVAGVAAFGLLQWSGQVAPEQLASGVFRSGNAQRDSTSPTDRQVVYYRDGKTASVSLRDTVSTRAIVTNGKPDAAIELVRSKPRSSDEITMAMLAGLPLSLRSRYDSVAVVGFGSGLTSHVLLGSDQVGRVDTIEIEPVMVDAARGFGVMNERVYFDKRSNIIINDARTHFAAGNKLYDLVISEPSNPWVSGVASLFTVEYYDEVRRHLAPRGIMVQWIHAYELNDELLATMIAAVLEKFRFVEVYVSNEFDLMLIASQNEVGLGTDYTHLRGAKLMEELAARGISLPSSYLIRRLADTDGLRAIVAMSGVEAHSDFFPVVALRAPEARFRGQRAELIPSLATPIVPLQQMAHGRAEISGMDQIERSHAVEQFAVVRAHWRADSVRTSLREGQLSRELNIHNTEIAPLLAILFELSNECAAGDDLARWIQALVDVSSVTLPFLAPESTLGLFEAPVWLHCAQPNPEQMQWLRMMTAIAQRDSVEIERVAQWLASHGAATTRAAREYLLLAALLARIERGEFAGAARSESDLGIAITPDSSNYPTRSYLLALAEQRRQRLKPTSR